MDTPIATNSLTLGSLLDRHARYRPHRTATKGHLHATEDRATLQPVGRDGY